jgi:hydroxymethylpyrimidine/phosphomethylpyrimidine kinase
MRREAPVSPPVVLTIAGSDSGGGAGIQADLKTIEAVGGFGTSAITSVTAQNTRGVTATHGLPTADIRAQIDAVREDFEVAAVKTGMLGTAAVVDLAAEYAPDLPNLVVDPVMVAASGDRLLEREAEAAYERLVGEATVVTPNADEAAVLTDVAVEDEASATRAGRALCELGADAALVKGGHVPGDTVRDVLVTAAGTTTIRHDRVDTDATHGSGCTLSSAIATELARGVELQAAVTAGVALLGRAVRYNLEVGDGPGAVHHLVGLREAARARDTLTSLQDIRGEIEAAPLEGLSDLAIAAAPPYAEEPSEVLVVDAAGAAGDSRPEALRLGSAEPVAAVLLAGREVAPALRFALAVRHEDAVGAPLDGLDAGTVTASADDDSGGTDAVTRRVAEALETTSEPLAAIEVPDGPGGPATYLLGDTHADVLERARSLAAAMA